MIGTKGCTQVCAVCAMRRDLHRKYGRDSDASRGSLDDMLAVRMTALMQDSLAQQADSDDAPSASKAEGEHTGCSKAVNRRASCKMNQDATCKDALWALLLHNPRETDNAGCKVA